MLIQDAIVTAVAAHTVPDPGSAAGFRLTDDRDGEPVASAALLLEAWGTLRSYAQALAQGRAARQAAAARGAAGGPGEPAIGADPAEDEAWTQLGMDPSTSQDPDHPDRPTRARRSPLAGMPARPCYDPRDWARAFCDHLSPLVPRDVVAEWFGRAMSEAFTRAWEQAEERRKALLRAELGPHEHLIRDPAELEPTEASDWAKDAVLRTERAAGLPATVDDGSRAFRAVAERATKRMDGDRRGEPDPNRVKAVAVALCQASGEEPFETRPGAAGIATRWVAYQDDARRLIAAYGVLSPRLAPPELERDPEPDREPGDPVEAIAVALHKHAAHPEDENQPDVDLEPYRFTARGFVAALEAAGYRVRGVR